MPGVSYSIIGSGPEAGRLQARAVRLGVADRVRFHGHLEAAETYGRIKAARLLVLPSVREGFGMAVAEAQAAGTVPVVVRSPHSGAADLVRDGVDGLVVPRPQPRWRTPWLRSWPIRLAWRRWVGPRATGATATGSNWPTGWKRSIAVRFSAHPGP